MVSRAPNQRAKSEFLRSNFRRSLKYEDIFVWAILSFIQVTSQQISIVHFANNKNNTLQKGQKRWRSIAFV